MGVERRISERVVVHEPPDDPRGVLSGCTITIKVLMGSTGPDAESGPAPIDCSGIDHPMLFFGGDGRDRFIGTDHGDFFNGGVDIDWLYGGEGPDFLCASEGEFEDDECSGGLDTDLVVGAVQNDDVFGDEAPDSVHGASDVDTCDGGDFEDQDLVHTGESEEEEFVTADDGILS